MTDQPFQSTASNTAQIPLTMQGGDAAAPVAALAYFTPVVASAGGVWREQNVVVLANGAILPDRCVKCNCENDLKRVNKKMTWAPPWCIALILLNVIIMLIVYLCVQKSMRVNLAICKKHRSQRTQNILITWGIILASIVGMIGSAALQSGPLIVVSIVVFLGGIIYGFVTVPILKPKKIDKNYAWLKGAGNEFLQSIPDVSAPVY